MEILGAADQDDKFSSFELEGPFDELISIAEFINV
jgi:hypothetical protein